jgi:hypothetical protein
LAFSRAENNTRCQHLGVLGEEPNTGFPRVDPAQPDRIFDLEADTGVALRPEEADVLNVGFSWAPVGGLLEGFQIDLDY